MNALAQLHGFIGRPHGLPGHVGGQVDVGERADGANLGLHVACLLQLGTHLLGQVHRLFHLPEVAIDVRQHIQRPGLPRAVLLLLEQLLSFLGHAQGIVQPALRAVHRGHRQQAGGFLAFVPGLVEDSSLLLRGLDGLLVVVLRNRHLGDIIHRQRLAVPILQVLVDGHGLLCCEGRLRIGLSQHVDGGELVQDAGLPPGII
mmetsp:Transcript_108897/g.259851  ORF Transcript_108897/g.259851 Transcript_108897/m.259851 type:complete len:202 (-) Transcript_108897:1195-1800(-)